MGSGTRTRVPGYPGTPGMNQGTRVPGYTSSLREQRRQNLTKVFWQHASLAVYPYVSAVVGIPTVGILRIIVITMRTL
eukprot:3635854-Rhodomonas_salina.1